MSISRRIAMALAAAAVLSSVTACAVPENRTSITASAGAEKYARFLTERLGDSMPEDLVIAMGDDAAKYGADLSGFADDEGYTIRANGGDVVILGKSDTALDRAVRQYANYGNADDYAYTYGEDYRVGGITIAGNDISEYSIMLPEEVDECHTYAADNLREYIGRACGVYPEIAEYSVDADGKFIRLERVYPEDERYAVLGDEGFTITVDDAGDLTVAGGYLRGCMYGVFDFLEQHIGWRFFYDFASYGNSSTGEIEYLYEAEQIDIPAGTEYTEVPSFVLRRNIFRNDASGTGEYRAKRKVNSPLSGAEYNPYNILGLGNHGIHKSRVYELFPGFEYSAGVQPCFTDEEIVEISKEFFIAQTQAKIDAGQRIGYDFTTVDVSQLDFGEFCQCSDCLEYVALDIGYVGPVLYYTNEMARALSDEFGDELQVSMLAYWGTSSVPKVTRPEKNVNVSYCFYNDLQKNACYNHCTDGLECSPGEISNKVYGEELRGWCEIAETVTVWYYPGYWWNTGMISPNAMQLRNDVKFLADAGVDGFYVCASSFGMADEKIIPHLLSYLAWDADITEEEYEGLIREYYMIMGGDGYEYLYEHHKRVEDYAAEGCWSIMAWSNAGERLDLEKMTNGYEYDVELFERAKALADCSRQERFVTELSLSVHFTGLVAVHSEWYLNGDDASRARYEELYSAFIDEAVRMDYTFDAKPPRTISDCTEKLDVSVNLAELFGSEKVKWWIPAKYRSE